MDKGERPSEQAGRVDVLPCGERVMTWPRRTNGKAHVVGDEEGPKVMVAGHVDLAQVERAHRVVHK